jgi:hypothetical protein
VTIGNLLQIGTSTFELTRAPDAHIVAESVLGQDGPFEFPMEDWGAGLLPVINGIKADGSPRYVSAKGVDASFPGQLVCQPIATVGSFGGTALTAGAKCLKQVDFGAHSIFAFEGDRRLRRYTGGGWADTLDLGAGNEAKDLVVQGGYVIVAYGPVGSNGTGYQYTADPTAGWTNVATAADRFGVLSDRLWRGVRPNSAFSTDGPAGAWSASTILADAGYNITSISAMEQLLLIGKEDGVYSIDAQGFVYPLAPELRVIADTNMASLRANAVFNGEFYFRTRNGMLLLGIDASKTRVGMDMLASPDLPAVKIKALAQDDRYLYAMVDNDAVGLMILRASIAGAWHVFYWGPALGRGQHMAVSNVTGYPALWFSYTAFPDTGAHSVGYIRLSSFANPRQDSSYLYDTASAGVLFMRGPRFGSARQQLTLDRVVFQSEGLSSTRTAQLYLGVDGGAPAAFGAASTVSPKESIAGGPVTGNFFDPYIYLSNNASGGTPVVAGFAIQGMYRPERRLIHTFALAATRELDAVRGGRIATFAEEVFDSLKTLRDLNTFQAIQDENGRTFQGLVVNVRRQLKSVLGQPPDHTVEAQIAEQWAP